MAETLELCARAAPSGTRVTTYRADVSDETQMLAFRDTVLAAHGRESIDLLINNAGIGAGGGFVAGDRAEWERTFAICWYGVYYGARTFMPLLVKSAEGHIVNISSVNGFWASLGPGVPHTAYSAAKFAVKGFTEALISDLRLNAPQVGCSVVMPGHIGTSIMFNTWVIQGFGDGAHLPSGRLAAARARLATAGAVPADIDDDALRAYLMQQAADFRDKAPITAEKAAGIILDGVRAGRWRILIGEDAHRLDRMVRNDPESAYEPQFALAWREGGD